MAVKTNFRRILLRITQSVLLLVFGLLVFCFAWPCWNRLVVYPTLERERAVLWSQYKKPGRFIPHNDYKGVLHSHSGWSHDSRGILPEIIPAARQAGLNFIFLADHRHSDSDSFPRGIHGVFDGIIVESGTESGDPPMMVSPLRDTVLDWSKDRKELIRAVVREGGMVFYVHSENRHDWANPDYQGMEIYNIHTDLLDEKRIWPLLFNAMVNSGKYRHWGYREIFDEQTAILARWDSLNGHRRIVGMAAVDAHNNQNIRARVLPDGRVEWVGPDAKTLSVRTPGWKERLLLGKPDAGGWAFNMGMDTYFHSFNYVNTHIFGDTLSARALRNELVRGHAYISFESLAKADGFQFFAAGPSGDPVAIMGDSIPAGTAFRLRAVAPYPVRWELFKDGKLATSKDNDYAFEFPVNGLRGNYRVVARLKFRDRWLPWIYTNPIYVYQ